MQKRNGQTAGYDRDVAVVVLNRDRRDDLLACLASLRASRDASITTVVIDNGSSDDSLDAVAREFPEVHLLPQGQNRGVSGGRNAGARFALQHLPHAYLLFLDNDTVVDEGFVARLCEALGTDPEAGIACGKAHMDATGRRLMSTGISVNLFTGAIGDRGAGAADSGQFDTPEYVDASGGFAMMIRRDLFWRLDAFDESFNPYGWEDVDFCLRARRLGYRTAYVPAATVWHKGSRIGRAPVPAYERTKIRHYLHLVTRHASPVQLVTCMVVVPVRWLVLAGQLVRSGHLRAVSAHLHGVLETVRGRP